MNHDEIDKIFINLNNFLDAGSDQITKLTIQNVNFIISELTKLFRVLRKIGYSFKELKESEPYQIYSDMIYLKRMMFAHEIYEVVN